VSKSFDKILVLIVKCAPFFKIKAVLNSFVTPRAKFPEMIVANWQKFKLSLNDASRTEKSL
jgi:hypothetical protein